MTEHKDVAKRPCGTCPYRRDVPSGIWSADEYDKLPHYDGEMAWQNPHLFACHQNDGKLCAGWLACHGDGLAIRLALIKGTLDPSVLAYETDVPVFASGAEACAHGKRDIDAPSRTARAKMQGLLKLRGDDDDA